jgi:hypothetical protein
MYNLISCAFTSAGSPKRCIDPGKVLGQKEMLVNGKVQVCIKRHHIIAPGVSYKYCMKCKCIKPPRAHHDSVTGKCIFEMDHYCPWMNNCIGLYNYRFFVLFMTYLFMGCVYIMIITGGSVLQMTRQER